MGLCLAAGLCLIYAYPKRIRKKMPVYIYACKEDELPVQGVRPYYLQYPLRGKTVTQKIFIVTTDNDMFCLSPVCTHLGCQVTWFRPESRFLCPCHGGQYDINGNVVAGPPPSGLSRLAMKIENQKVYIGLKIV